MKDNKVNQKIQLYNWKIKLFKNLSSNNYLNRYSYLINEQNFINYLKIYLYNDNENDSNVKDFSEIINNTDLSKIKDSKIAINKLPKLFALNYDSISSFQKNNIENIKLKSIFNSKLLRIEITELDYCIFFLYKNKQLRQGYLRIKKQYYLKTLIDDQDNIGFYNFIKRYKKEINDDELIIKEDKFEMFVFKYDENEDALTYIKEEKIEPIKSDFNNSQKEMKHIKLTMKGNKDKMNNIYQFASSNKLVDMKSNQNKNIKNNNNEDTVNDLEICPRRFIKTNQNQRIKRTPSQHRTNRESNKLLRRNSLEDFLPKKAAISLSTPGIIGLLNIGATCYMNATLQCLSNLNRLKTQ